MGVSITSASAALKIRYSNHLTRILMEDPMMQANSFIGLVQRKKGKVIKSAMGQKFVQPLKVRDQQTANYSFSKAQAKSDGSNGASKYHALEIPVVPGYATGRVDGQAQAVADGDTNAFVDLLAEETDGALRQAQQEIAMAVFKSGTGSRARITAVTASPASVTVAPSDTVFFEIDQNLVAAAADGTGSLRSVTALTITGINPVTGVMTLSADPTALSWSAAAGGDYLYVDGDFVASTKTKIVGLDAWNPVTVPGSGSGDFLGILEADRIANWKFYGLRQDAAVSGSFKQALIDAQGKVKHFAKGKVTHGFANPLDWAALAGTLETTRQTFVENKEYNLFFDAINVTGPAGTFPLLMDSNVPKGRCYLANMDHVYLVHAGDDIAYVVQEDGNTVLRKGDADAYEVRVRSQANLMVEDPSQMCVIYGIT